tara:strand:- start:148 stop:366 length:219 start_codon:yes stop_codon:yes gene_type:complete
MNIIIKIFFFYFINFSVAYAYLDPGTGSIILQAILFILAGIGTFFAFFKNKVKEIYNKLFKKNNNKKDNNEE